MFLVLAGICLLLSFFGCKLPILPNTSQYFSITSHSKQVFTLRQYSVCRFFTAFAGSRIDGGFWGNFGRIWEGLGEFGCIAASWGNSMCGGKYRKAVAVLCAGGCRTGRTVVAALLLQ